MKLKNTPKSAALIQYLKSIRTERTGNVISFDQVAALRDLRLHFDQVDIDYINYHSEEMYSMLCKK